MGISTSPVIRRFLKKRRKPKKPNGAPVGADPSERPIRPSDAGLSASQKAKIKKISDAGKKAKIKKMKSKRFRDAQDRFFGGMGSRGSSGSGGVGISKRSKALIDLGNALRRKRK